MVKCIDYRTFSGRKCTIAFIDPPFNNWDIIKQSDLPDADFVVCCTDKNNREYVERLFGNKYIEFVWCHSGKFRSHNRPLETVTYFCVFEVKRKISNDAYVGGDNPNFGKIINKGKGCISNKKMDEDHIYEAEDQYLLTTHYVKSTFFRYGVFRHIPLRF